MAVFSVIVGFGLLESLYLKARKMQLKRNTNAEITHDRPPFRNTPHYAAIGGDMAKINNLSGHLELEELNAAIS